MENFKITFSKELEYVWHMVHNDQLTTKRMSFIQCGALKYGIWTHLHREEDQ